MPAASSQPSRSPEPAAEQPAWAATNRSRTTSEIDNPLISNFLSRLINSLVLATGPALRHFHFSHVPLMLALRTRGMLCHLLLTPSFHYVTPVVLGSISYA
ncbi:hypothetical protein [Ectopseudomonas toyotomiensis]|uniref:hypothetical protein n=1 Tax=Ectopseudomonas toyotomiensis TaxID=554344 RepID=UPI003D14F584